MQMLPSGDDESHIQTIRNLTPFFMINRCREILQFLLLERLCKLWPQSGRLSGQIHRWDGAESQRDGSTATCLAGRLNFHLLFSKRISGRMGRGNRSVRTYTGYGVIRSFVSAGFFRRENSDLNCAGVTAIDGLGRMDGRIHRAQRRDRN
jgi:hypothetical protein